MKLTERLPSLTQNRSSKNVPAISLNAKYGTFNINSCAANIINLKAGDVIKVFQDEEGDYSWFISKVNDFGYTLRAKGNGSGNLRFTDTGLVREIQATLSETDTIFIAMVESNPTFFDAQYFYKLNFI